IPGGLEVTVPAPVPVVVTVSIWVPAPPVSTESFMRSPLRLKAPEAVEQLTRIRMSPVPLVLLTKSASVPEGLRPAISISAVPTDLESSCTQLESVQRKIETSWVHVNEDLSLYVASSDDTPL